MKLINKEIENYVLRFTEKETELLHELSRQTYLKTLQARMLSGHLQGRILAMFSKMIQPKYILEIGTFTGYSAICLAEGLQPDGKLITIEKNDELEEFASKFFKKVNLSDRIDFRIGDALKIIPELDYEFDLAFIDAHKPDYLAYYQLVIEKVKSGGTIIADNVLWDGKVNRPIEKGDASTQGIIEFTKFVHQDKRVENVIFPVRDGLMVLRKL